MIITTSCPDGDYLEQVWRDTRAHAAAQRAADRMEYGRPLNPAALGRIMHAWVSMSLATIDDGRSRAKVERSLADTRPNVPA